MSIQAKVWPRSGGTGCFAVVSRPSVGAGADVGVAPATCVAVGRGVVEAATAGFAEAAWEAVRALTVATNQSLAAKLSSITSRE